MCDGRRRGGGGGGSAGRAMLAALVVLAAARGAAAACGRPDAWCDGVADCADGSDEPAGCSPCNRTYSGRAGDTYRLALGRPARAPFLCHLTFAARGGGAGDVVQLALDEFRVGRYAEGAGGAGGARDACPDGHLALAELGRPYTGGSWCGQAAGAALYYSETPTVTATLRLTRLRLGDPFAFQLRYKFIAQRDAVVRFGAGAALLERGAVSPGTYCTRTFDECHRKRCSLQSPNYPGMYPRNVSCYWSLRQKDIPTCKHAMIAVRQDHSHKMQIKRSISMARLNATRRGVWAWGACGGERDRLIFYDGATTDDPVLLEFCGGDWLPRVASRGPDMLVAFHSAPFSAPPPPLSPNHPLRGFELDVEVVFADSDSLDYVREARRCEFHVKASSPEDEWEPLNETSSTSVPVATAGAGAGRGRRGVVRSPAHTLPPGAACSWTFHGRATDQVWFYFSSFTHYSLLAPANESTERDDDVTFPPGDATTTASIAENASGGACPVWVEVWEGAGGAERRVAAQCGAGRVCARAALAAAERAPRPCSPPDAHVSAAPLLSLRVASRAGTATHPLRFVLHYEFVDAALLGDPLPLHESEGYVPTECARVVSAEGAVWSARNVLWFGGGGAASLRCVTRLAAGGAGGAAGGARAAVTLAAAALGPRPACDSRPHPLTGRLACVPHDAADDDEPLVVPHLLVYEVPWPGFRVPLACICDNSSAPLTLSGWGAVELVLAAPRMSPAHTPHNTHYRGGWRRAPADCSHHARPPHHVYLTHPPGGEESECAESPWLLSAHGNRSVVVRLWGVLLTDAAACRTSNRLLVYSTDGRLIRAVCPGDTGEQGPVEVVFSEAWQAAGGGAALQVVWAAREGGAARFSWMQVWRAPAAAAPDAARNDTARCRHACAALGACMRAELWCDGRVDCPGGADEAAGCGAAARLLRGLRAGGAAAALAAAAAALLLLLALRCWRRRAAPHKPHKARLPDEPLSAASTLS